MRIKILRTLLGFLFIGACTRILTEVPDDPDWYDVFRFVFWTVVSITAFTMTLYDIWYTPERKNPYVGEWND